MFRLLCGVSPLTRVLQSDKIFKNTHARISVRSLQLAVLRGGDSRDSDAHAVPLRALLVDAAGTLILPSENVPEVYLHYAKDYGCNLSPREILLNFRRAFNSPWRQTLLKYSGDGRPFWHFIVAESTGCADFDLSERLYTHYARPQAWKLVPGAAEALSQIRSSGVKLAVVSNFDTRLRPLLEQLNIAQAFDTLIISAEVGVEKPNPLIFEIACERLGVQPLEAVHVGDDRRNDITGARAAGCYAWLWGSDVRSFQEVGECIRAFNRTLQA